MKCCPTCGQEIDRVRYGVKLGRKKIALFDAIAKCPGISQQELTNKLYERQVHKSTIATHVSQIKDLFAHTDVKIVGRPYAGYTLHVPKGMKK